jgi:hypothetical protein
MEKLLSSEEFLRHFEAIWEEDPKVRYRNPDAWV